MISFLRFSIHLQFSWSINLILKFLFPSLLLLKLFLSFSFSFLDLIIQSLFFSVFYSAELLSLTVNHFLSYSLFFSELFLFSVPSCIIHILLLFRILLNASFLFPFSLFLLPLNFLQNFVSSYCFLLRLNHSLSSSQHFLSFLFNFIQCLLFHQSSFNKLFLHLLN